LSDTQQETVDTNRGLCLFLMLLSEVLVRNLNFRKFSQDGD